MYLCRVAEQLRSEKLEEGQALVRRLRRSRGAQLLPSHEALSPTELALRLRLEVTRSSIARLAAHARHLDRDSTHGGDVDNGGPDSDERDGRDFLAATVPSLFPFSRDHLKHRGNKWVGVAYPEGGPLGPVARTASAEASMLKILPATNSGDRATAQRKMGRGQMVPSVELAARRVHEAMVEGKEVPVLDGLAVTSSTRASGSYHVSRPRKRRRGNLPNLSHAMVCSVMVPSIEHCTAAHLVCPLFVNSNFRRCVMCVRREPMQQTSCYGASSAS